MSIDNYNFSNGSTQLIKDSFNNTISLFKSNQTIMGVLSQFSLDYWVSDEGVQSPGGEFRFSGGAITYADNRMNGNNVLLASPGDSGAYTTGPENFRSFERTIFHELTHGVVARGDVLGYVMSDGTYGINISEQVTTLIENIYYTSQFSGNTYVRSHLSPSFNINPSFGGVMGHEIFSSMNVIPVLSDKNDNKGNVFTAVNSDSEITKTHNFSSYQVDCNKYDNYININATITNGSRIAYYDSGSVVVKSAISHVVPGMMTSGNISNDISTAIKTAARVENIIGISYADDLKVIQGLGADRYTDGLRDKDGNTPLTPETLIDYAGVIDTGTLKTASVIAQKLADGKGGILVGAAGWSRPDWVYSGVAISPLAHNASRSNDVLIGGDKADILIPGMAASERNSYNRLEGKKGNDILLGSPGIDHMYGGEDDDLLISSSGSDVLHGDSGRDAVYYGNQNSSIVYISGIVNKFGGIDSIFDIEVIFGSDNNDFFNGDGTGMTFYGGKGEDIYYAGNGPDSFIDEYAPGFTVLMSNEINFEFHSNAIDLTLTKERQRGASTEGHLFENIGKIRGSSHDDIFRAEFADNTTIHGGSGDDTFYVGSGLRFAYGEEGDDRFIITSNVSGVTINGGANSNDEDVLDFSQYGREVRINLGTKTFTGDVSNNNFIGIEKFYFGSTAMSMTGTSGNEEMRTGSAKSYLSGGDGIDTLIVTTRDEYTPASHSYIDVVVNGGAKTDYITAHRGATLNGDGGDDIIVGSDEQDLIRGGSGDEIMFGMGGNETFFANDLNGRDLIDAGDGIDTFSAAAYNMTNFDFSLKGDDLDYFAIQFSGQANDANTMLFHNLERTTFGYASSGFRVSNAMEILLLDTDHYMTGSEMKNALILAGKAITNPPMTGYDSNSSRGTAGESDINSYNGLNIENPWDIQYWPDHEIYPIYAPYNYDFMM